MYLPGWNILLQRNLSPDFEFKFREATFDSQDRFNVDYITIGGNVCNMENPIYSRILVDGTRLSAGIKYHF